MIKALLVSMRPHQWSKNLVIFAGLIFSQNLFDLSKFIKSALAFLLFCLLSGSVYLINDVIDLERDRQNPRNSHRPITKAELPIPTAIWSAVLLAIFTIVLSLFLNPLFALVGLVYFILMIAYSFILKHIVILDIMAVSLGFLLRAIAGAVVISVEFSPWLLICTILLALFLITGKRRHELIFFGNKATEYRRALKGYSPQLLDQMVVVVTAGTLIAYILYTIWPETVEKFQSTNLKYTIPFVLLGIFRYLYLVYKKGLGDTPEIILIKDKPLMVDIGCWILATIAIIYFLK